MLEHQSGGANGVLVTPSRVTVREIGHPGALGLEYCRAVTGKMHSDAATFRWQRMEVSELSCSSLSGVRWHGCAADRYERA
jgi:hypothetical protein